MLRNQLGVPLRQEMRNNTDLYQTTLLADGASFGSQLLYVYTGMF